MQIAVVSRFTSETRILENVSFDKEDAEAMRQSILKRYAGAPSSLCEDTEVQTFEVEVWVATQTKAYGATGEDPKTDVLVVGTRANCLKVAKAKAEKLAEFVNGEVEFESDEWRAVDADEDALYIIELHKV